MKNNKIITVTLCIILIIAIIAGLIIPSILNQNNIKKEYYENEVYHLREQENTYLNEEEFKIVSNTNSYSRFLNNFSIELDEDDFEEIEEKDYKNFNYLLIIIPLNSCGEDVDYDHIKVDEDNKKLIVEMSLERRCGVCAPVYDLYEIKIPKKINEHEYEVEIDWDIEEAHCDPVVAYKPVLYLYPSQKTDITVNFSQEENLTTTYPKFKEEWKVTAYPNGDLYDSNNNYYYALYWEEKTYNEVDFKEGFYVNKDNAINFLEEKLTILGLNKKERNEFIMYWLPILEKNVNNLVYFELTSALQNQNELIITPQPDTLIRIRMHIKKVNNKTDIKEQQLHKQERIGSTAIEWGGVIHN